VVTTFAGLAFVDGGGAGSTDGTGAAARFRAPSDVAADGSGNIYVSDTENYTIRKITSDGLVSTFAGKAGSNGVNDGTGNAARFQWPSGLAVDGAGNVYVADPVSHTIRKITPVGVVSTFAGSAFASGSVDGKGSAARFQSPSDVAVDISGNVYVADGSRTIRKISSDGVVSTLAGKAFELGSADGTGSTARFSSPSGIACDQLGNLYVSDSDNHTIRKVTSEGIVTTVAGKAPSDGGGSGSLDGEGSAARFVSPRGLVIDNLGNIYVADFGNYTIRRGSGVMPPSVLPPSLGADGKLGFEVIASAGQQVIVETTTDLSAWAESQRVTGQGAATPVRVNVVFQDDVTSRFWRVRRP
jgi:sugar lactone lactonase YvrE